MLNQIQKVVHHANGILVFARYAWRCVALVVLVGLLQPAFAQSVTEYRLSSVPSSAGTWSPWFPASAFVGNCQTYGSQWAISGRVFLRTEAAVPNCKVVWTCNGSECGNFMATESRSRVLTVCESRSGSLAIPSNAIVNPAGTGLRTYVPTGGLPGLSMPVLMCVDGCRAGGLPEVCGTAIKNGVASSHCYVDNPKFDGETCVPTPTSSTGVLGSTTASVATPVGAPAPPVSASSSATCPGEFNGVVIWVPCVSTTNYSKTVTAAVNSGTTTVTVTTSPRATTCDGNSCTTTTAPSGGAGGGSGGNGFNSPTIQTQDQSSFCKANPTANVCATSNSSFAGSCSGGFTCTGDAAQCAAARGIWEARCALTPLETNAQNAAVVAGNAAITGLDPSTHPRLNKENKSAGTLDNTNPFTNSCPADVSFHAVTGQVTVPLSSLCSSLQLLGYLAIAITLIVAARIVAEGV